MAAATQDRQGQVDPVHGSVLNQHDFPVAGATTIFSYTLVSLNATGYAEPAADVAGQAARAVYYSLEQADNSTGADGEKRVRLMVLGTARPDTGALTQADVGNVAHVLDDSTAAASSTNTRPIGTILEWTPTRITVQIG
jgi:hypothetical protein